jgi:type IV pilus assembly protein PilY1
VAPVDLDGDHSIDFIYAGDLKGNLWRFEPTSNGTNWGVSLSGQPLFTARDANGSAQPITVRPLVFKHPYGGVMVVFGTGKFFEVSDAVPNTSVTQSLYGVWDRFDGSAAISRNHLLEQEFIASGQNSGYDLRVSSKRPMTWHPERGLPTGSEETSTHLGWYLDLVDPSGDAEGELIAAEVRARGDRAIFTSMIPSTESCDYGGEGWLIELSYLTGQRPAGVLFDLDDDGRFRDSDMITIAVDDPDAAGEDETEQVGANAKKSKIGIVQQPAIIGNGAREYKYNSGGMPADIEVTRENPGNAAGRRASWLERK